MTQALEGIRIIDMTHNQAGPAGARILAFLGAGPGAGIALGHAAARAWLAL